jgi:hypothetical protein
MTAGARKYFKRIQVIIIGLGRGMAILVFASVAASMANAQQKGADSLPGEL